MSGTNILREGTTYVLVEVSDGYQIWDRDDYFADTPRGCPRDYYRLNAEGEHAAWRSFYALEPPARTGDGDGWDDDGDVDDEIGHAVFCAICGVELAGEGRFCSACGAPVEVTADDHADNASGPTVGRHTGVSIR